MFETGELVVYGTAGICRVIGVGASMIPGDDRLCYQLRPVSEQDRGTVIHTPVEERRVMMRRLHTPEELYAIAAQAGTVPALVCDSDRQRREQYKQALASCDLNAFLSVLHAIEARRTAFEAVGKHLSETDERFAFRASDAILCEAATVLSLPREELVKLFGIPSGLYAING